MLDSELNMGFLYGFTRLNPQRLSTINLLGKEAEAEKALESIHKDMNVIENMAYHRLCLFYKGELALEEITGEDFSNIMNDAAAYGVGNWYLYNGQRDVAKQVFEQILENKTWASFGHIAAEADFVREFSELEPSLSDS